MIEIQGFADVAGYIDKVEDVHTGSIDDELSPGGILIIEGHKDDSRTKVTERFSENEKNKVNVKIPASLVPGGYRVEIVSRYSGGGVLLKEPGIITYPVMLTVR